MLIHINLRMALIARNVARTLLTAVILFCLPREACSQEAGRELDISIGQGLQPLGFRYCPSGDLIPNPPVAGGRVKVRGFYILSSEVSQQQYFGVLDWAMKQAATKSEWEKAGARMSVDEYLAKMDKEKDGSNSETIGDQLPVYKLGIHEAVQFCKTVQQLSEQNQSKSGPVRYTFRLATLDEWQYACRARQNPDDSQKPPLPFFNVWPPYDGATFLEDRDRLEFGECWNLMKMKVPFDGSQQRLADFLIAIESGLLDADDQLRSRNIALKYLAQFLKLGLHIDHQMYLKKRARLAPVNETTPNGWGIRDMHGNIAEWVVATHEDWFAIAEIKGDIRQRKLHVCGGHFASKPGLTARWQQFTIGGSVAGHDALDYQKASNPDVYSSQFAGIRPVLEVAASPQWLAIVRQTAVSEPISDPKDLRRKLQDLDAGVSDLKKAFPEAAETIQPSVTLYKALILLRGNARDEAMLAIADWMSSLRSLLTIHPLPTQVRDRLSSLDDEAKDLESIDPILAKTIVPSVHFYQNLVRFRAGDDSAGQRAVQEWGDKVRANALAFVDSNRSPVDGRLGEFDSEAEQINSVSARLGADAKSRLNFGKAVINYRSVNRSGAAKAIGALERDQVIGGDGFFDLVGSLVELDSVK